MANPDTLNTEAELDQFIDLDRIDSSPEYVPLDDIEGAGNLENPVKLSSISASKVKNTIFDLPTVTEEVKAKSPYDQHQLTSNEVKLILRNFILSRMIERGFSTTDVEAASSRDPSFVLQSPSQGQSQGQGQGGPPKQQIVPVGINAHKRRRGSKRFKPRASPGDRQVYHNPTIESYVDFGHSKPHFLTTTYLPSPYSFHSQGHQYSPPFQVPPPSSTSTGTGTSIGGFYSWQSDPNPSFNPINYSTHGHPEPEERLSVAVTTSTHFDTPLGHNPQPNSSGFNSLPNYSQGHDHSLCYQ